MRKTILSWGKIHKYENEVIIPKNINDINFDQKAKNFTLYGNGRSYGDVCLNKNGNIINTKSFKKVRLFNTKKGIIEAEAGITFDEILKLCVPKGWFIPVTPGTKFVTLGGAIANDVHGKNHHQIGSFGSCIKKICLIKTNGQKKILSRNKNFNLFKLTISGLGLTGFIHWAKIKLIPIKSSSMHVENIKFNNLEEYFIINNKSKKWPYTVAWFDNSAEGKNLGKGIFSRGYFLKDNNLKAHSSKKIISIPNKFPGFLLNKFFIKIFNKLYWNRPAANKVFHTHYDNFFYPLDKIKNWNNLYGDRGFYQFQCIFPEKYAKNAIKEVLSKIKTHNMLSFLAVFKTHKKETSPGLNSFCISGTSIAIDLPNKKNDKTIKLLKDLEKSVLKFKGKINPSKDSIMSAKTYKKSYPNWIKLNKFKDPYLSSSFWERVTKK
tara:strand:+ start:1015 stop:2319 length:1305 start_codon:yes stop_codon:yes gene_type:complete